MSVEIDTVSHRVTPCLALCDGKPKTLESFSRLSEEFTIDDVMRCFSLDQIGAAKMRVNRLLKDHLVEKIDDFVDNGTTKARYRKIGFMTQ